MVVPPTEITSDELAGEPIVLYGPESPLLATTVMPARTSSSLNTAAGSSLVSGYWLLPNDSLTTSTWSWVTAQSSAASTAELNANPPSGKIFSPTRFASGAMPSTRIVQP